MRIFRISITNAPGAETYPISSFTCLLIPETIQDAAKRDAIKAFLKWMLTDRPGLGGVSELRQTAQGRRRQSR